MSASRLNLNDFDHHSNYIVGAVFFLILAAIISLLFYKIDAQRRLDQQSAPSISLPTSTPTIFPTPSIQSSVATDSASPSSAPSPSPTPAFLNFSSSQDGFSVDYSSSRQVYQDQQSYGRRFTFYHSSGNFAVHVGDDWSWVNPGRQFSSNQPVDGQPSFYYQISAQTIVDIKFGEKFYTIQCVHQGSSELKSECLQFINSFKFVK